MGGLIEEFKNLSLSPVLIGMWNGYVLGEMLNVDSLVIFADLGRIFIFLLTISLHFLGVYEDARLDRTEGHMARTSNDLIFRYAPLGFAMLSIALFPENVRTIAFAIVALGVQYSSVPLTLSRKPVGELCLAVLSCIFTPLFAHRLLRQEQLPSWSLYFDEMKVMLVPMMIATLGDAIAKKYRTRLRDWHNGRVTIPVLLGTDHLRFFLPPTILLFFFSSIYLLSRDPSVSTTPRCLWLLKIFATPVFISMFINLFPPKLSTMWSRIVQTIYLIMFVSLAVASTALIFSDGLSAKEGLGWVKSMSKMAIPYVVQLTAIVKVLSMDEEEAGEKLELNRDDSKVIIVGGGIGGMVMAACLEQLDIPYVVFEKRERNHVEDGADLALWPSAIQTLKEIGVNEPFWSKDTNRITAMLMREAESRAEVKRIDLAEVVAGSGEDFVLVSRVALMEAIRKLVPNRKISYGWSVTDVANTAMGGAECTVDRRGGGTVKKEVVRGSLLVAADGAYSLGRKLVAPGAMVRFKREVCVRGMVDLESTTLPTEVRSVYREIEKESMTLDLGSRLRYSIGFLNSTSTLGYWFLKQASDKTARDLTALDMERFEASWPKPLRELYHRTEPSKRYINSIEDAAVLPYWSRDRVVLLGDAAHPVTPNTGQGACLAIDDAITLSTLLSEQRFKTDGHIEAFYQYEKRRKVHAAGVASEARIQMAIQRLSVTLGPQVRNKILRMAPTKTLQKRLRKANMIPMDDILASFRLHRSRR